MVIEEQMGIHIHIDDECFRKKKQLIVSLFFFLIELKFSEPYSGWIWKRRWSHILALVVSVLGFIESS